MGCLAVLFLAVYTVGKCRDEADMYKMLRAIGMPVRSIRIMVFIDILVRLVVSIFNGILLGILFALGLSMQIEEFLMIKTPAIDLSTIMIIGAIMILVFSFTVVRSTSYLGKRTVQQTNKL